jgi:hypothetical protein
MREHEQVTVVEARSGGLVSGVATDDLSIESEHVGQDPGSIPSDHLDARTLAHVAQFNDDPCSRT